MPTDVSPAEALEALAAALDARQFATTLVTGENRVPRLRVVSRYAKLSEDIYADSQYFWYSWAERIAPVNAVPAAAAKVTAILRITGQPSPG